MREELRVPVEKLRRVFNPEDFHFSDTSEVEPVRGFIGQERAVQALDFGLRMDSPDYNIFIVAQTGISRNSALLKPLDKFVFLCYNTYS